MKKSARCVLVEKRDANQSNQFPLLDNTLKAKNNTLRKKRQNGKINKKSTKNARRFRNFVIVNKQVKAQIYIFILSILKTF